MLFSDTYRMISESSETVLRFRGSRFLGFAWPVKKETEIKELLKELRERYPDATHHCYAWVLGADKQNFRINDDGEPSGSAGRPILRQIQKAGLTNVLLVVVRYFGGTLLGVPGLIEAYGETAASCLGKCTVITCTVCEKYRVSCPYGTENEIFRICRQFQVHPDVKQSEACFSAEIEIPLHKAEAFKGRIRELYRTGIEYIGAE